MRHCYQGPDEQSPESGLESIELPIEISILDQRGYLQYGLPNTCEDILAIARINFAGYGAPYSEETNDFKHRRGTFLCPSIASPGFDCPET
ncbi:hypothetical protein V6N11_031071 [Hibiscus sabdariffa]|uniref:Uncharacterized protein n=1 Tax=Hibiscus sabdariffa TaxID=183260 RepID=A0ABR1ZXB7_9ROSI